MANWVFKSADHYLSLLYERLHELIYDNHIIHADETSVKVMRIDNNKIKNGRKTYMWGYRNRPTEKIRPIVLFDWQPSRKSYLRTFLNNGDVPMDNNYVEQAIRPFTIGRKNFVLIETSNGARSSAMIYNIDEPAKANYMNVYQYFELLLPEIPKHMNDTDLKFIDELLPWAPRV